MKKFILSLLIFTCLYGHSQKPLLTENFFDQKQWVDSVYSSMNIDQKIEELGKSKTGISSCPLISTTKG